MLELERLFRAIDSGEHEAATSVLTLAEVMVLPIRNKDLLAQQVFLKAVRPRAGLAVMPVSEPVLLESARLRAQRNGLRLPDAIHLATARLSGCTVFLTNDRHFESISEIDVVILGDTITAS